MEKIYVINLTNNKYYVVGSFEKAEELLKELIADGFFTIWDFVVVDEEGFNNIMSETEN